MCTHTHTCTVDEFISSRMIINANFNGRLGNTKLITQDSFQRGSGRDLSPLE